VQALKGAIADAQQKMPKAAPDAAWRALMSPAGRVREQIAYVRVRYAYACRFPLVMIDVTRQVPLAIAPVAGLSRVVCAAPDAATALGCDIAAALEEPNGH
jgi:hypothetical protein